jgi:hypothetical protein
MELVPPIFWRADSIFLRPQARFLMRQQKFHQIAFPSEHESYRPTDTVH